MIILVLLIIMIIVLGPSWSSLIITVGVAAILGWRCYHTDGLENKPEVVPEVPPAPKYDYRDMIENMFSRSTDETKISGDDRFLIKAKDIAGRAQEAIINRARYTSDNFRKYFEEELALEENRHWWENDELDVVMFH